MQTTETENRDPRGTDLQRRAYRTLNEDGLVDLGVGLGLSFAALYTGLPGMAGAGKAAWAGLFPALAVLLLRGLRKRYVYPRIGYAQVRKTSPGILLMAAVTLVLVAGVVVTAVYARRGVRPPETLMPWLLRLFALAGAAILGLMGYRTGLVRFYVHAAVTAAAALASLAVRNTDYSLTLMLGLPGLSLLVTGTACFFLFLRRHPKPEGFSAGA